MTEPTADTIQAEIRKAYASLAEHPGAWVGLAPLRARLADLSRTEVDRTLRAMVTQQGFHIVPVANLKSLTTQDRAAALRLGGEDNHAIMIEESVNEPQSDAPNLADADHEYFCAAADQRHETYDTWAAFAEAEDGGDIDRNLLFRWDWTASELELFFALQRKGQLRSVTITVRPEDEPAVRAYLRPRLEHLLALWAPLTPTTIPEH